MADLSDINSAESVKIIGSNSTGVEQTPVQSTSNGGLHTNLRNNAGTEIGTSSDPVRIDPTGTTSQPVIQSTASNLNAQVVGNVAHGATDSGNPVKVGAKYNSTLPTVTDGQRTDLQTNRFGELAIVSRNSYINLVGNGTTTVKSGAGRLHLITINNPVGTTATIYDNTAGSGTKIATIFGNSGNSAQPFSMLFDITFTTGLTIVITGSNSSNLTVSYQ